MRIVKGSEFLTLPAGTVFSTYEPHWFGPLQIKGERTGENDWLVQHIPELAVPTGIDIAQAQIDKIDAGESLEMDFDLKGRSGFSGEPDRLFAVWEPRDVEALIDRLQRALDESGGTVRHLPGLDDPLCPTMVGSIKIGDVVISSELDQTAGELDGKA